MAAEPATLLLDQSGDETTDGFSFRETYRVITTSASDGPGVVLNAPGLPLFFQAHSGDPFARVNSRRPIRQTDARTHWHVEIGYAYGKSNDQDQQNPPTLRPVKRAAKIRWVEKALMKDRDGKPIITGAKTPFNPPLTVSIPHSVASFQRWENSFSTATQRQYAGAVNSSSFGAFDAGEVLCTDLSASEEWEQNEDGDLQRYWLVNYEFEAALDPDKWEPRSILDADFWFIDSADSKRKPIYVDSDGTYGGPDLENGVPVPTPIPLDSGGEVLQASELPESANYLEFSIAREADFNALGLPVY